MVLDFRAEGLGFYSWLDHGDFAIGQGTLYYVYFFIRDRWVPKMCPFEGLQYKTETQNVEILGNLINIDVSRRKYASKRYAFVRDKNEYEYLILCYGYL